MGPDTAFFLSGRAHVYYGAMLIILAALYVATQAQGQGILLASVLISIMAAGIFVDVWVHGYRH